MTSNKTSTVAWNTEAQGSRLKTQNPTREQLSEQESTDNAEKCCPECDGDLKIEGALKELHCDDCGLILDEQEFSQEPEWTAYNHTERQEKSRVGSPIKQSLHDKGLSTQISWKDKDAKGQRLSSKNRRKMNRLRKWNSRSKTSSHKDECLSKAFTEIQRMGSSLGLPKTTTETASVIFRQARENGLLPGRSIEGTATAALHIASVMDKIPRSYIEVTAVSRVGKKEIVRTKMHLERGLGLKIEPVKPEVHIPRIGTEIGATQEHVTEAKRLTKAVMGSNYTVGKKPTGLATAALYAGSLTLDIDMNQCDIANNSPVCEITIRDNYKSFLAEDPENSLTMDELEGMNSSAIKKALSTKRDSRD